MDKRTTGIVATVASALLCGLPGLCICVFGAWAATGTMPYNTEFGTQTSEGVLPSSYGFIALCLAIILILIPVLVGFLTLRRRPEAEPTTVSPEEPLPPAS